MGMRTSYPAVADSAAGLLAAPAGAGAWDEPSALRYSQVSGLAGHLAGQIFFIDRILATPVPDEPPIPLLEYYRRVTWVTAGHDDPVHVRVRTGSIETAAAGPAALAARAAAPVEALRTALPAAPADRTVRLPTWGPWSVRLDDFVPSRLIQPVGHAGDPAGGRRDPPP